MPAMKPRMRTEQITVVQLDGEAVVYDERTGMLHHLNPEGTLLYRLCDGTATVRQLASEIAAAHGGAVDEIERQIRPLIRSFREADLLEPTR